MITVFTPTHDSRYLWETYLSLKQQTLTDWEWVIVVNNGLNKKNLPIDYQDKRIRVFASLDSNVGALKAYACSQARGDILVELDHDDLLVPSALEKIAGAFQDQKVMMAYSNHAEFKDESWESHAYSEYWGWRSRPFNFRGKQLVEMIAWPPSAHMMRRIEFAPNHVRAFRTTAYQELGGHAQDMELADDHDLCCRFYIKYGERGIKHIDECLYLYRVHERNTCRIHNEAVQKSNTRNYLKYSRDMFTRWATDGYLLKLDLGGRFNAWPGFTTVDLQDSDVIANLDETWPFETDSVGIIRASHIFEHLKDPIHTMNEAYRVLAPGGFLLIDVPSTDGRGAFQDPTHKSFWNSNSIWYYTDQRWARFIQPDYRGRFQVSRVVNYYPTEFEKKHNIPVVQADLIAYKTPYTNRPVGEVLI